MDNSPRCNLSLPAGTHITTPGDDGIDIHLATPRETYPVGEVKKCIRALEEKLASACAVSGKDTRDYVELLKQLSDRGKDIDALWSRIVGLDEHIGNIEDERDQYCEEWKRSVADRGAVLAELNKLKSEQNDLVNLSVETIRNEMSSNASILEEAERWQNMFMEKEEELKLLHKEIAGWFGEPQHIGEPDRWSVRHKGATAEYNTLNDAYVGTIRHRKHEIRMEIAGLEDEAVELRKRLAGTSTTTDGE